MAKEKVDLKYTAYELGMAEAKALIRITYVDSGDDDIIDLAEEEWPGESVQALEQFLDADDENDLVIAKNFIDGMEDGFRAALMRWYDRYKRGTKE